MYDSYSFPPIPTIESSFLLPTVPPPRSVPPQLRSLYSHNNTKNSLYCVRLLNSVAVLFSIHSFIPTIPNLLFFRRRCHHHLDRRATETLHNIRRNLHQLNCGACRSLPTRWPQNLSLVC